MTGALGVNSERRPAKTSLLAPLTTFRFFAALAIVVFHVEQDKAPLYLASGVSFFFVLSGFVLTYVHPRLDEPGSFPRFWIARLSRIWPLHVFTFLLVLAFRPFGWLPNKHFVFEAFCNVFLLQCWIPVQRVCQSFNLVSWSLSVEMFFYAVFPLLLPWVFRHPARMFLAAIALNVMLATGVAFTNLPDTNSGQQPDYVAFLFWPPLHLYEFVLGMAAAVWWLKAPRTSANSSWGWIEIVVLGGVLFLIPQLNALAQMLTLGHTGRMVDLQMANFLRALLFALVIYVFAFQAGLLSRLLSQAWLVYLGEISFSIYMIHCIIFEPYRQLKLNLPSVLIWSIYGAAVFTASALLYRFLEKPARKGLAAFLDRRLGLAPK